mgnify:CR=1 FL=1
MRLNKYLARSGIASRRKCDRLIEAGKVIINGSVNKNFGYIIKPDDVIVCDGSPVYSLPITKVFLVNKLKYLNGIQTLRLNNELEPSTLSLKI